MTEAQSALATMESDVYVTDVLRRWTSRPKCSNNPRNAPLSWTGAAQALPAQTRAIGGGVPGTGLTRRGRTTFRGR